MAPHSTLTRQKPNILLITTDQQRFDTIGRLGNRWIDTPHLDWLVDEGIWFGKAYADSPICMPSRATIMTGMCGATLGLTGNTESVSPLSEYPTLPGVLTAAGYQTRAQGKMHFHPMRSHYGFETMELPMDYYRERHRLSAGGSGLPKQHGVGENEMHAVISTVHENDSLTHWTVQRSIDFIETRDPTRPFFLWTSFTKPHPPFDPPAAYWALYANRTMPDPVYGDWSREVESIPQGMMGPTYTLNNVHTFSSEQLANSRRAYYAAITHIDFALGLLFARMRELGLLENTWIVFTSDHGENLGDHHMGGKSNFLEGSAHIPLIIRPPAAALDEKPFAGSRVDTVVSLADIMPTILSCAEIELSDIAQTHAPSPLDGADLLSFVGNPQPGRWLCGESSGRFLAVIEVRYKYHYTVEGGAELLFDLHNDPHEQVNLVHNPEHAEELSRLRGKLISKLVEHGSSLVVDGKLVSREPIHGPQDVRRWPGFHSTVVDADVLH